jgi:hypothetical protein
MRFLLLLKSDPTTETGLVPDTRLTSALARYGDELARAGVLLSAGSLRTSQRGARITFAHGKRTISHGPFSKARELVAGYWLIDVPSRQQAIDWACRCPGASGELALRVERFELEVREVAGLSGAHNDAEIDEAEAELRRYMLTGS